jgi:AmiR/NasT family two-component response regulator
MRPIVKYDIVQMVDDHAPGWVVEVRADSVDAYVVRPGYTSARFESDIPIGAVEHVPSLEYADPEDE